MSSPFPGMDPYLEDPVLWPGFHGGLAHIMRAMLNALLPPGYMADMGERLYVVQPQRSIYPDVVVLEHPPASPAQGGVATAVASDPAWVLTVEPVEVREVFIEILALTGEERVVTAIEFLSPANKQAGSEGRTLYFTKQREILQSQTHLIEIDLLRQGEHTVAPPRAEISSRGYWNYLASLHRGGQGSRFEVWAFTLRQRLPRIRVPLADDDPDIVLDLQAVLDRCYDEGGYARRLNYRREPPTVLTQADEEWVSELLRAKGLR